MSEQKNHRRLWKILLIASLAVFVAAAVTLAALWLPGCHPVVEMPSDVSQSSAPAVVRVNNPIDFAAQQAENPDICGWIRVPGTVIDYPVMRSGDDTEENFYLHHGKNRKYYFAGCIYMQKINDPAFTDANTVLYGHNMRNGSMFAALHKFKKEKFFAEHDTMCIYTPGHILTYRLYSVFVYDDRNVMHSFNFNNPVEYENFLAQTREPKSLRRQVREGVNVTTADRIVTLSTCTGKETERLLLVGVLIDDQLTY